MDLMMSGSPDERVAAIEIAWRGGK